MTGAGTGSAERRARRSAAQAWRSGLVAWSLLLTSASLALAGDADGILLTSGVVKAVDPARGLVVLGSGWTLRVRSVIVNGQVGDVASVRLADVVFVSGTIVDGPGGPPIVGERPDW